jgi:hypothetical protein
MLHWLLSGYNKFWFLLELVIVSTVMHGIVGILLFVVYPQKKDSVCIELGKVKSPTLFVPLRAAVPMASSAGFLRDCSGGRRGMVKEMTRCGSMVRPLATRVPAVRKVRLSSDVTLGVQDKKSISKKDVRTKCKARAQKLSREHHEKDVGVSDDVHNSTVKTRSKCTSDRKEQKKDLRESIGHKSKEHEELAHPIVPEPEPIADKSSCPTRVPVQDHAQIETEQPQEISGMEDQTIDQVVLGAGSADGQTMSAEQARMYECIEQEIVSRWRPPRGLSKDLTCSIKCSIGTDGSVTSCTTEKSSGVLVYDMSARMASLAMKLPRWAWGKDFIIIYKQ